MGKGRKIKLEQRHRAESDPAVAAASILARADFLLALRELAEKYDVKLPKGASSIVIERGVELVDRHGPAVLLETAKCHFRTADRVLSDKGLARAVLGPNGQAQSKVYQPRKKTEEGDL